MGENKRYYWLKLKKDFFDSKEMKKLRKLAGGDTFTIIYLKMQLLSLTDEGKLYFDGVEDSFAEEIALQIDEDPENVKVTILYLQKVGLVEMQADNKLFLPEVPYMTGSETNKAEFMRQKRQNKSKNITNEGNNVTPRGNIVTQMLPDVTKCYTEIEKEIEIEKEKDTHMSTDVDDRAPDYQKIVSLFNQICVSLPKVEKITAGRKQRIKAADKELNGDFEGFFRKIEASDFLTGRKGDWCGCCFDWVFKPQNIVKIIEGNYDNKEAKKDESYQKNNRFDGFDFGDEY